jgi:hypothetical protein
MSEDVMAVIERKGPRLVGGVHRDVTGRASDPLRFYLSIDRGLASGRLDDVTVGEAELLRLIADAAQALAMLRNADAR